MQAHIWSRGRWYTRRMYSCLYCISFGWQ